MKHGFMRTVTNSRNILVIDRLLDLHEDDVRHMDFVFIDEQDDFVELNTAILYELTEELKTLSTEELPFGMRISERTDFQLDEFRLWVRTEIARTGTSRYIHHLNLLPESYMNALFEELESQSA